MRVLFALSSWSTHWYPLAPLAWTMQSLGHEVQVLCSPVQGDVVARSGALPVPVLPDMNLRAFARMHHHMMAKEGHWPFSDLPPHPTTGQPVEDIEDFDPLEWYFGQRERVVAAATVSTDAAAAYARRWHPDLVVHDQLSIEGPLVGRVLDVPAVLHLWGPSGPDDKVSRIFGRMLPVDHSNAFARFGVGEMTADIYRYVIDPCPPSMAPPLQQERLRVRYQAYNGCAQLTTELPAPLPGRPRVVLIWGSEVSSLFGPASFTVPKIVDALAGTGAEVVLAVGGPDRQRIGPLPSSTRLVDYVPLRTLLSGASAIIHHGGAGCVMTAVAAGVPQLVLYNGFDQEIMSGRLARTEAGIAVANATATVESIRSGYAALMGDPAATSAAVRLAAELETNPSHFELASTLEGIAAGGVEKCVAG
ncbi:nucleotide disphospho-sugar-binding domain-containing protein [Amycolatopsis sp. NPDC059090]|uniref:nucleotide disphospho-sugar-binding domain-containing protein n=1 Tax=unclassified Amycolatopsis TaxID=2618356 RepID=UPI00366DEDE8